MIARLSQSTQLTAVVAGFFLLLILIVIARSIFRSDDPPAARRFRVGVFVERDHELDEDQPPKP